MRQVRARPLWTVAACLTLAAACTGSDSDVDAAGPSHPSAEERDGEWTRHILGTFAADQEIVGSRWWSAMLGRDSNRWTRQR